MLSDEWLPRYGLLENFNASVTRTRTGTRTGTGTWTTGVTAIALCTSCSRANKLSYNTMLSLCHRKVLFIKVPNYQSAKYCNFQVSDFISFTSKFIIIHRFSQTDTNLRTTCIRILRYIMKISLCSGQK